MKQLLTLILFLLCVPAQAAPISSLFYHTDDISSIDDNVDSLPPTAITPAKHLLHLDSILFINSKHWTVWLQGQKITPQNQRTNHRVFDVNSNSLRISAKLQNGHTITKTLCPHQSLNLLTGDIIEGSY